LCVHLCDEDRISYGSEQVHDLTVIGQETQKGQSKKKEREEDDERQFEKAKLQGVGDYG